MSATIRSATARLDADIGSYVAKMRIAGRETEAAFSRAPGLIKAVNRELGITELRLGRTTAETKAHSTVVSGLATRTNRLTASNEKLNASLGQTPGRVAAAGAGMDGLGGQVRSVSGDFDRGGSSIDRYSGRLGLLAQAAVVGLPAITAIGALGGPALGAVGAAGVAGALGVGSLVTALAGVADAVKAVDAYQLDPTVANLEKAQRELGRLGPDAVAFVAAWDGFQPVLDRLQNQAAAGWMPGLIDTLGEARDLAPQVGDLLERVGRTGGALLARGTESLTTQRWRPFLDFLGSETTETLDRLARIVGDLAHGAAEMWMAFDPGNDAALDWVADVADGFDRWASSEQGRRDVAAFLAYARENGPKVQELFTSMVDLVTQIVQAAAPLSGPTLTTLTKVVELFAAIAGSDLGTPILAGATALAFYNRTLAATAALQKSTFGKAAAGTLAAGAAPRGSLSVIAGERVGSARDASRAALQGARRDIGQLGALWATAGARTERETARMRDSTRSLGRNLGSLAGTAGRAAGPIAAIGVATSGVADGVGLSNTAMLGLTGTMLGPWGAAAGSAIGLGLDLKSANDQVTDSVNTLDQAMVDNVGNLRGQRDAFEEARAGYNKWAEDVSTGPMGTTDLSAKAASARISEMAAAFGIGTSQADRQTEALARADAQMRNSEGAAAGLAEALGMTIGPVDGSARSLDELQQVLDRAQPAMQRLGITQEQLNQAWARSQLSTGARTTSDALEGLFGGDPAGDFRDLSGAIAENARYADSMAGRTQNLVDALIDVDAVGQSAADSAKELKDALDALLGPGMNLSAARDELAAGLAELDDSLAKNRRHLLSNTAAGRQNRAEIRDRVANITDLMVAERAAGAGSQRLGRIFRNQRQALADAGVAAGLSGKQLRAYLREIGFTPRVVRTVMANTADQARGKARNLNQEYDRAGRPRTADMRLSDHATGPAREIARELERTSRPRSARVSVQDQASPVLRSILGLFGSIPSHKSSTVTTTYRSIRVAERGGMADGGTVTGERFPYRDKVYIHAAPGEEVIGNRYGQADRFRADRAAGRIPAYAGGGTIAGQGYVPGAVMRVSGRDGARDRSVDENTRAQRDVGRGLRELRGQLRSTERRLARQERALDRYQNRLESLTSQRSQYLSTVRGNFTTDPFATDEQGSWAAGAGSDPLSVLRSDIGDAKQFERLTRALRRRGLRGQALLEIDSLQEAITASRLSRTDLRAYQQLFNQRAALIPGSGNATAVFADRIKDVRGDLKDVRGEIRESNIRIRQVERAIEKAEDRADKSRQRAADGHRRNVNQAARNAQRGRTP